MHVPCQADYRGIRRRKSRLLGDAVGPLVDVGIAPLR
jgi:hypothetical protein